MEACVGLKAQLQMSAEPKNILQIEMMSQDAPMVWSERQLCNLTALSRDWIIFFITG